MAHPQNSPRGLFAKTRIDLGAQQITASSTALLLNGALSVSGNTTGKITMDSTGRTLVSGGLTITGKSLTMGQIVTGDSTAFVSNVSALPGDYSTGTLSFGDNSTGSWVAVRTTGTTWKYLNVTTVLPT